MEPDDLSFIEISGEDDSLLPLQHITIDDVSSLNKTYFACSPLQIPRSACSINNLPPLLVSPIVGITGNEDVKKLDLLSNTGSVNKENASTNKPEMPPLNMEPQQMKRKKKGGGYNLRKSLAWHKAFLTEEGVLDPIELSMISGNSGKSSGQMLSVIEEDGRESLAGNSKGLTALEEKLFKELPAKNPSEAIKSSGVKLQKKCSPAGVKVAAASAGKLKVLSAHDVNRSGSKRSGCPRPVASSSLKRPANVNTTKSTTKELKVSRIPVRKLDTSVHSVTAKNITPGASNTKRNQISQLVSVQRNVGSKVGSNSTKSTRSDARSDSTVRSIAVKSSVQQARRNVTNSAMENRSSAKSLHPLVNKTKNSLKIDTAHPLPTSANVPNNHVGDSSKVPNSLPIDGSMQFAQIQTEKSSGLRMPSPSLGFFNQSKASASHSLLPRSNQACNVQASNIPNFKMFGTLNATQERLIPAPGKMPDMANAVTATNTRIQKSIKGSSIPTNLSTDSREEMKPNLNTHEIQKVELDVPSNSNSGNLNNQQNLHSLCNDIDQEALPNAGPIENEKNSHVMNNESKSTDNKLLLHRALTEKLKNDEDDDKRAANIYPTGMDLSGTELEYHFLSHLQPTVQVEGVFETKDMVENQCVEEKMCNSLIKNHATSSESQSGDATSDSINARQDNWLGSVHDVYEQSRTQDEAMIPCIDLVSSEGQKPCMNNDALTKEIRYSEFHNCKTAKIADGSPEVGCCSGGVAESSHGLPHSEDTVEAKDSASGIDNICTKSQAGDVEVQSVYGILSAGSGEVVLCSSTSDKMAVDDMIENMSDPSGSESASSGAGFCIAETAACPHGDDTISGFTDAQLSHEIMLQVLTTSGEPEMIGKDQSINAATTTIVEVSNVCPNSRVFSGCELDLQLPETQPSVPVQTENGAGVNSMIAANAMKVESGYGIDYANEEKGVENKLSNHFTNFELQPADYISYCQHNTSTVYFDLLTDVHMVCRQSVEENQSPKASDKFLSEDDYSYFQRSTSTAHNDQLSSMHMFCPQSVVGIQFPKASDERLSEDGMPFEESGESYMGKVTDISLDVKSRSGRVPESPHNLFQPEHAAAEPGNEEIAGFDNTIKKSLVDDAQMQVLEGSLLTDSCNSKFNAAVVDEIHNSDLVAAQGSLDAHGSCLNDRLFVNSSSSEEYQDNNVCGNLMDDVLEKSDACANESNSSIVFTQVAAAVRKVGIDEDQKAEEDDDVKNLGVIVLKSDFFPEEASISQNNGFSKCEINHELENPVFATEDATMSSSGVVFQDIEVNILASDVFPEDAETSISQKNGDLSCDRQCELEDAIGPTEEWDATECPKKYGKDKKQDNLAIKPPPHAVPFSDEWLAAFEAAGEEILTMKSGAVKHSPPDKSLPEPGPWSPVKRKNNQGIGPFDCTKYTNGNINTPPSDST